MELELIKNRINRKELAFCEEADHVQESDIIVPDYLPDAAKIIEVGARAYVKEKVPSTDTITLSGEIIYHILYLPEGENRGIKCVAFSDPFRRIFDAKGLSASSFVTAGAVAAHVEGSLTNSRKINLRAVINLRVCAYNDESLLLTAGIEKGAGHGIETMSAPENIFVLKDTAEKVFALEEEAEVPYGKPAVENLLKYELEGAVRESKVVSGKVVLKGALLLSTMYSPDPEGMTLEVMTHEIPFSQILDVEGVGEDGAVDVELDVLSANLDTVADESGELRRINLEASMRVTVMGYAEAEAEILKDAYSIENKMRLDRKTVHLEKLVDRLQTQMTLREAMAPPPGMPDVSRIVRLNARVSEARAVIEEGKLRLNADVIVFGLYLSDRGQSDICEISRAFPLNYSKDMPKQYENASVEGSVRVSNISCNINMASEIEVRVVCDIIIMVKEEMAVEQITGAALLDGAASDPKRAPLILYYPQKDETVWQVAKRYSVPMGDILSANSMTANDALAAGQMIVVPAKGS